MLERGARCIETAGEHLLRNRRVTQLRSRRTLQRNFWQYAALQLPVPLWCLGVVPSPSQCTVEAGGRSKSDSDAGSIPAPSYPFLEFLYPPRTLSFVRDRYRNAAYYLNMRKRRKLGARGYASSSPSQGPVERSTASSIVEREKALGEEFRDEIDISIVRDLHEATETNPTSEKTAAMRRLEMLLDSHDPMAYEEAWELVQREGCLPEYASTLLSSIATSDILDIDAGGDDLLDLIPLESRSPDDYWSAVKIALDRNRSRVKVIELCDEAVEQGKGARCWGLALAAFVDSRDWDRALLLLMRQPSSPSPSPPAPLPGSAELLNLDTLQSRLLSLLSDVEKGALSSTQPGVADLAKLIVHHLVSSKEKLMELPIGSILLVFEKLVAVGFLEPLHYFRAITTLQSQGSRAANTKSVLIYRNFRWRMPDEPAPAWLLEAILGRMRSLRIPEGVDYFLQEFRHLHEKPSLEAYQNALTTFARCGDSSGINEVFRKLVEDHGPPTDQKLISPLLYIHAKVGNVKETKSQLQNLSREFSFEPNVVCWNILLTAHANRGDLDGAIESFRDMSRHGTAPDSHSFGIMMGLLAKRGDYRAVKKLLDVARRDKVPLTSAMIDPMVEALCRSSKYAEAEEVARDALLLDPPLDMTRTWNLLLWNYAFTADFDSVSRIQAEMRNLGVAADGMTYASIMLTLILMRDTDAAREILRKLHRSRRVEVEKFHYSLIMLGYAREGNRDMVQILYREMTERFGDPGPSANLSMLRSLIQRDEWSQTGQQEGDDAKTKVPIRLERAERFLEPILARFELSDYATSKPQPGSGRRPLRDAFPSAYYETLMSAYARRGAWDRAEELFDEYMKKAEQLSNPEAPPLQFMSAVMETHLQKGRYKEVEDCWNSVRRRMVDLGTPLDINRLFQAPKDTKATSSKYKGRGPGILRFYRFALSQCLSVYMESLSKQKRWANLKRLVGSVEKQGFALTTANWAVYIRLLCDSQRPEYQLLACQHFEEKFMQNFPGWTTLRQGYVRFPAQAPQSLSLLDRAGSQRSQAALMGRYARRAWAKIQPDFMQPDYLTMMHLASALVDLRFRAVVVGDTELDALQSKAPQTFEALSRLPLLTEEFQSDLRLYLKPHTPTPRAPNASRQTVFTGGLLGPDDDQRIDTSPREVVQEDFAQFDGSVLGRHFDDQGLPAGTSEPDEETLRYLLAEDAHGHENVRRDSVSEQPPPSPLQTRDEQDLEHESRLAKESGEETEEGIIDSWNEQYRRS